MGSRRTAPALTILTLVALALPAVEPLFRGALACTDDAAFHLLRLTQLDALLREGIWFSRWAPDMAGGYGYPIFNYYAPLSYYAAEAGALIAGNLNLGLRLAFAAGLWLSGITMYLLTRQFVGRPAGLAAAAAYLYAPYQGYDVYFRGNLAESFAWWILPLALWAVVRLARDGRPRWVAASAAAYAAVLLTHNVFALIFTPLFLGVGAWETAAGSLAKRQGRPWLMLLFAWGLGLALAAFFWVPALAERHLVHADRLLVPPVFVYWGNFLSLGELLALPRTVHPDLLNPSIPRAFGLVHLLVALPSLLWLQPGRKDNGRERGRLAIAAWVTLGFLVFMMLPASRPVWDALPLIEFIQFPWRLLGPAALLLALLVALGVEALTSPTAVGRSAFSPVLPTLIVIPLLILSTLYWFDPRLCPGLADPTAADIVPFEQASQTVGTTAKGEYLPRTVDRPPSFPYAAPFAPPPGVDLLGESRTPLRFAARVRTSEPADLTVNAFAYPGWTAMVDGAAVPIRPTPAEGLIIVPLPAGESEVVVTFRETPFRLSVDIVSLIALVGLLALITLDGWQKMAFRVRPDRENAATTPTIHSSLLPLVFIALIALAVITVLPRLDTILIHPRLPEIAPAAGLRDYEDGLRLLDYRLLSREMPADGSLPITLWLTATRPLQSPWQSRVQLVDAAGEIWSGPDTVWPRVYRPAYDPRDWPVGTYVEELLLAEALAGTPPGTYTIELVVFDRVTGRPARLVSGETTLPLGTVELTRPATPFEATGRFRVPPPSGDFGPLRLRGVSPDRTEAAVGDPFLLEAYWEALRSPEAQAEALLQLVDEQTGETALERSFSPVRPDWPTTGWKEGDVWLGRYRLRLPAALPAGGYRWTLCLVTPTLGCGEPVAVADLHVSAPVRRFELPAVALPIDSRVGEVATLAGADLTPCPSRPALPCAVELVWRAEGETGISYRAFVQLLGPDGRITAQSDGEPAGWTRPTTGWLAGEVVRDVHRLADDLSAPESGLYTLIAGLYNPDTGERLLAEDGATAVVLAVVEVR